MSRFMSKRFEALREYVPGEQPQDMQYIKLNTNESPYPPSRLVMGRVLGEIEKLGLYPDPECTVLRDRLSALYGMKRENTFLSNGSDEILNFAFAAFCDETVGVAFADITYGFYRVFAELYGIDAEIIPLRDDFTKDVTAYENAGRTVFIANPNAPTGLALPLSDIEKIVKANSGNIVVVDEAYVDFGAESAAVLVEKYDNLLVVGTYSKSRSMAGARLGFGFANEHIIADLERIKYSTNPYNINRLTLAAGEAAIDENSYYMDNCKKIIETREKTMCALEALGFSLTDSKANFIFARHPDISGGALYRALKERGILVRHFDEPRISDYNRISIGTPEQMNALVFALSKIIG